jgi:hypothetical protein
MTAPPLLRREPRQVAAAHTAWPRIPGKDSRCGVHRGRPAHPRPARTHNRHGIGYVCTNAQLIRLAHKRWPGDANQPR